MIAKHLLDSATALPYLRGSRILDLGSGAGLPGIVIAMLRPDLRVHLLDSRGRRVQFLIHAISRLALVNAVAIHDRFERYRPQRKFDTLTARAVTSIPAILAGAGHLCRPGGRILVWKGGHPAAELDHLPAGFTVAAVPRVRVPGVAAERHLVLIETAAEQA